MNLSASPSHPRWLLRLPAGSGFALRTAAAALLALYVAFLTSMQEPKWAAMTVFIVAQADRGMSLSKGRNRVLGTCVGAAVAIALMAAFAQSPELFLGALALWLGGCTAVAGLLPGFRAYGAVLAGYTAMIVGISANAQPEQVFEVAVARSSEIVLGIVTEAVLAALFLPASPRPALEARLEAYLRQASALCARLLRGEADDRAEIHRFFATALQFDEMVQYAAAASHEVARCVGRIRRVTELTLAQLLAAQSCHDGMPHPGQVRATGAVQVLLERRAQGEVALLEVRAAARMMEARLQRLARLPDHQAAFERAFVLERGLAILEHLRAARREQAAFLRGVPTRSVPVLDRHRDITLALHNGLRAFLAVLVAALFWIHSAWSNGAGLVTIVGVVCALYATRPDPVAGGLGFFKGAGCAAVAALACDIALLPHVADFPSLALVLAPFLVAAGMAMRRPASAAIGASFSIFFIDLLGPVNGSVGEVVHMFNSALALLLGIAIGVAMFTVILPAGFAPRLRRMRRAVAADLVRIARRPHERARIAWFGRMADRMRQQLSLGGALSAQDLGHDLGGLLGALTLGSAAIDLASLERGHDRAVRSALRRLARLDLPGCARQATRAARIHARAALCSEGPDARWHWRQAMLLRDMAMAARRDGEFIGGVKEGAGWQII